MTYDSEPHFNAKDSKAEFVARIKQLEKENRKLEFELSKYSEARLLGYPGPWHMKEQNPMNVINNLKEELTQHLNTSAKSINSLIAAFQLLAKLVGMFETEDHLSFIRDALTLLLTQLEATGATLLPQLTKVQSALQPAPAQTPTAQRQNAAAVPPVDPTVSDR